jgi:two-component system phosphate regulon response regulator PhoB
LILAEVLVPDLILLDWNLPDLSGEKVLNSLLGMRKTLAVIVVSGQIEVKNAVLKAGASAFVSKANSPEQLVETIHSVMMKIGK